MSVDEVCRNTDIHDPILQDEMSDSEWRMTDGWI